MDIYSHQASNTRKTWALLGVLFVLIIVVGWVLSWYYGNPIILAVAVVLSVGMNIASFWFSDTIVLSMYKAIPVNKEEAGELWNIVENLSITAGLPMPKLYIIPDEQPNAFATGRNKEHSAIAVTVGLLKRLNKAELEGVIAHEFSHIGNKDILLQTVVVVAVGILSLLADFFLRSAMHREDSRGRLNAVFLVLGVLFIILSPIVGTLIQLAISRKREYLADATGALLTRYPEGLASALEKISGFSGDMEKANHASAHLFIASPFRGKHEHGFLAKLFMTHPPVEDRIKRLRA